MGRRFGGGRKAKQPPKKTYGFAAPVRAEAPTAAEEAQAH